MKIIKTNKETETAVIEFTKEELSELEEVLFRQIDADTDMMQGSSIKDGEDIEMHIEDADLLALLEEMAESLRPALDDLGVPRTRDHFRED